MKGSIHPIQMVDLKNQYLKSKSEINNAIEQCIDSSAFIKGPQLKVFEDQLATYLKCNNVVGCANGTDAIQLALMALDLKPGDEVIVPSFTYVATAEVIALLGLTPVMVDVDYETFMITSTTIENAITSKTKAIVPVHLFGQSVDIEPILKICTDAKLAIVEDNAQSLGAQYTFSTNEKVYTGTVGTIGTTSFFPSKNLGCYGDGGAVITNNSILAEKIRIIANHGQRVKYRHDVIGINSRLDTLQAAILSVKLNKLNDYIAARQKAASYYDKGLSSIKGLQIPKRLPNSTHVFHQYTVKVTLGLRDSLQSYLAERGIPSMIYYPIPLSEQPAFKGTGRSVGQLKIASTLAQEVLSLPMHTELTDTQVEYIVSTIHKFFSKNG